MKIKYSLPIIKNSQKEVLKSLKIKGYDFYEVWLDYIKDLDDKFLINLAKRFKGKIIFVFRRQNLEDIKLTLDKRQKIIYLLSKFNVLLDLDFLTQHEELEFFKKVSTELGLILSYHNYRQTPKLDYLINLITKMKRYNPDIFKVATFCQKQEDSLTLFNLLLRLKEQKIKYIVLGMGEKGILTRIFGSILGNEINFASLNLKDSSAKGQLTKKSLELILKEIS